MSQNHIQKWKNSKINILSPVIFQIVQQNLYLIRLRRWAWYTTCQVKKVVILELWIPHTSTFHALWETKFPFQFMSFNNFNCLIPVKDYTSVTGFITLFTIIIEFPITFPSLIRRGFIGILTRVSKVGRTVNW